MVKEYEGAENSDQRGGVLAKNFFPDATNGASHICQQAGPSPPLRFLRTDTDRYCHSARSLLPLILSITPSPLLRCGKSDSADSPAAPASRLTRGRRGRMPRLLRRQVRAPRSNMENHDAQSISKSALGLHTRCPSPHSSVFLSPDVCICFKCPSSVAFFPRGSVLSETHMTKRCGGPTMFLPGRRRAGGRGCPRRTRADGTAV